MSTQPLVLLIYADAFNNKVGQTVPYMEFFSQFGEVVLVHSKSNLDTMRDIGDVLVVPGGADVMTSKYGEAPTFSTGRANQHYEYLDENLLLPWLKDGRPVIGVCRGFQAINVALGGSLHQHMIEHGGFASRDGYHHKMSYRLKSGELKSVNVNSIHHQSIKSLSPHLRMTAWSLAHPRCYSVKESSDAPKEMREDAFSDDNKIIKDANIVVEAYEGKELPIVAFQYHPEERNCNYAYKTIKNFLETLF